MVACEWPLRRGSRADRAVRVGLAKGSFFWRYTAVVMYAFLTSARNGTNS